MTKKIDIKKAKKQLELKRLRKKINNLLDGFEGLDKKNLVIQSINHPIFNSRKFDTAKLCVRRKGNR